MQTSCDKCGRSCKEVGRLSNVKVNGVNQKLCKECKKMYKLYSLNFPQELKNE